MIRLFEEGFTQNRELSWLRFNERCLDEAADETVPTMERLSFIRIFISNLDEFFMVRVGSLLDMRYVSEDEQDPASGMTPGEQLEAIYRAVPELYRKKDRIYREVLLALSEDGIECVPLERLRYGEQDIVRLRYKKNILPHLHPKIISMRDPFPILKNKVTYIIGVLPAESGIHLAILGIPEEIDTCILLSATRRHVRFIPAEEVIFANFEELLRPFEMSEKVRIRVTRNAEIKPPDESQDMPKDFRVQMQEMLKNLSRQEADRLEIQGTISDGLFRYLRNRLELGTGSCFYSDTSMDIPYIRGLKPLIPDEVRERVFYPPFEPSDRVNPDGESIFDKVKGGDLLSSYPYDSMGPLLSMLKEASEDPRVRKIRMTIYRLADHPKIVDYLIRAAENGKKVRVLIELRARFDEKNNIEWANELEKAGCRVYYGSETPEDYKVHCKMCQIVMDDEGGKRYVTQIGTGNYNETTARLYTDLSIITNDQTLGKEISRFFKNTAKGRHDKHYPDILAAPSDFKRTILELIDREEQKGSDGRIFIKVNSVTDTDVIDRLSAASNAGVQIRMIVRGICCLLPGVRYCTENISVVNVVGRFLEHSRVYVFGSKETGDERMYIASADLMTRNTENRVELAFPVNDESIRSRIREILLLNYSDNVKGRYMDPNGVYKKKEPGEPRINSQEMLMAETKAQ